MAKSVYLDVDGRKVLSKDITYDDLVILYRQFYEKFNKVPTVNTGTYENNILPRHIVNPILKSHGLNHAEFIKKLGYKSNKQKYPDIKIGNIYGRWKVIKFLGRRQIGSKNNSDEFWLCECTCGSLIQKEISGNALKTGNSTSCGCVQLESIQKLKGTFRKKSFFDWCAENNRENLLDRWDFEKNEINPKDVSYCSHEWFYFKCDIKKHNSSKYQLSTVCQLKEGKELRCKYCVSFAQKLIDTRGENALELYWDYDKNEENPWEIPGSSKINTVWLKCIDTDYHGSYEIIRDRAIGRTTCPYCTHDRIHPKDSFGQLLINRYGQTAIEDIWDFTLNTVNPFSIAPSTRKHSVWLKCKNISYHPSTKCYPNDVNNHTGYCHYCAKKLLCKEDSLGIKYPESLNCWSVKNDLSPFYYYPTSNKDVWWKCQDGKHDDYKRKISDQILQDEFRCPECTRLRKMSFLQEKVEKYIILKYSHNLLHENKCTIVPINPKTNCQLPFDIEVVDYKLIIEVHGQQHYQICGFTTMTADYYNITPEEALKEYQWKDNYKKEYAIKHGYEYLEIPYWTEQDESYKKLIDNKILEINKKKVA